MKRLHFDKSKCTECHGCELMCSYSNYGFYNTCRALLQLKSHFPEAPDLIFCRQCANPVCLKACSLGALNNSGGYVFIDKSMCSGCGACVNACPFECIFIDADGKAGKCSTCSGKFKCASACKTGALTVQD